MSPRRLAVPGHTDRITGMDMAGLRDPYTVWLFDVDETPHGFQPAR